MMKNVKLAALLCLISLAFLSAQSRSTPSPAPSPSKAPVDAICDAIKEDMDDKAFKYCHGVFESYPTIHEASLKDIAIIANNVAQQRIEPLADTIDIYLSLSNPVNEPEHKKLEACVDFLRGELKQTLKNTMHLIEKGQYRKISDQSETTFRKMALTCNYAKLPSGIISGSLEEFLIAEGASLLAMEFITEGVQQS